MKLRLPVLLALWAISACFNNTFATNDPPAWIEGGAIVSGEIVANEGTIFCVEGTGTSLAASTGSGFISSGTLSVTGGHSVTFTGGAAEGTNIAGLSQVNSSKSIWMKFDGGSYNTVSCVSAASGKNMKLTGNMNIWVANGTVNSINLGNSAYSSLTGNLNIRVSGGIVKKMEGSWQMTHTGDLSLILDGNATVGAVSFGYTNTAGTTHTGNIVIQINGGTIGEKYDTFLDGGKEGDPVVLGFARNTVVTKNTELYITDGLVKSDYITMGGFTGSAKNIKGNSLINISGGTVQSHIYGTGMGHLEGSLNVTLSGGTLGLAGASRVLQSAFIAGNANIDGKAVFKLDGGASGEGSTFLGDYKILAGMSRGTGVVKGGTEVTLSNVTKQNADKTSGVANFKGIISGASETGSGVASGVSKTLTFDNYLVQAQAKFMHFDSATVTGSSTLTLTSANNTGIGTWSITGNSKLTVTDIAALGGASSLAIDAGSSFILQGGDATTSAITGAGSLDISLTSGKTATLGDLSGYTGIVTINSGTAFLQNTDNSRASEFNIKSGFLNVETGTLNATLRGAGGLVKTGAGTLTIGIANTTFTGAIELRGGTLKMEADDAVGSGNITFSTAGATLDANGRALANKIFVTANGTLSNGSKLTGDLTVSGGILTLAGEASTGKLILLGGSISGSDLNASSYDVRNGTINSKLTGTGALTKNTADKVTLAGANNYSGDTTISAGELEITGSLTDSIVTVGSNATLSIKGGSVSKNITLAESATLKTNTGYTLRDGQTLKAGHTSGVRHDIIGNLTTASGSTVNVNGTLSMDGSFSLGGGILDMGKGDTLILTGNMGITGATSLHLSNYIAQDTEQTFTLATYTQWTGSLDMLTPISATTLTVRTDYRLENTGTSLVLHVNKNPYALTWVGGAGNWQTGGAKEWELAAGDTGDTKFYNLDTVTFSNGGSVTIVGSVEPGSILVNGSTALSFLGSGSIGGATSLRKEGSSTLTLNASNTYTGGTTLKAGTLAAGGVKSFGTQAISLEGGTLDLKNFAVANIVNASGGKLIGTNYAGTLNITANTITLGDATTADLVNLTDGTLTGGSLSTRIFTAHKGTVQSLLTGATKLVKETADKVTLSGNNTYTGGTTVRAGELVAGHASAFGTEAITLENGTLTLGSHAVTNTINATGGTLTGSAYAGTLNINGGTVTLGSATKAGQVILNDGTLSGGSLTGSSVTAHKGTLSTLLTGSSSLNKDSAEKVILTGTQNYTGATTINAGELEISGSLTSSSIEVKNAGILNLTGNVSKNITLGANATLKTNSGLTLGNGQILTGGHQTGTRHDIAGNVTTSAGSQINSLGTLGLDGNLTLNGGTLAFAEGCSLSISGNLTVNQETTILIGDYPAHTNTYTLATYSSWTGDLDKLNLEFVTPITSRISYSLAQNGTTLTLKVDDKALTLNWKGGNGTWETLNTQEWSVPEGSSASPLFYNDDSVVFGKGGNITIVGDVRPGKVTVNATDNVNFLGAGAIIGKNTSLLKENSGTLTLNATNTYEGGTTLSAGTIIAGGTGSFGSGIITMTDGTLNMSAHAITNTINATGGMLSGTAYAGTLNVNGGSVTLGNSTQASGVTLNDGTLMGGSLNNTAVTAKKGTLSTQLTGTSSLTKESADKVILAGSNNYSGATTINAGELEITGSLDGSNITANNSSILSIKGGSVSKDISLGTNATLKTNNGFTLGRDQSLTAGHANGSRNDIEGNLNTSAGSQININNQLGINGNLTLNGGSIAFDGSIDNYDRISVTGSLILGGTTEIDIAVTTETGNYVIFTYGGIQNWDASLLQSKNKFTRTEYVFENVVGTGIVLHVQNKSLQITWDGQSDWQAEIDPDLFHNGDTMIIDTNLSGAKDRLSIAQDVEPVKIIVKGDQNLTMGGAGRIIGAGSLEKTGTGTLTLSTSHSYTGGTLLDGGSINVTADNGMGKGNLVISGNNGAKSISFGKADASALTQAGSLTNNGQGTQLNAVNTTLEGNLFNTGSMRLSGNLTVQGEVALNSSNSTLTLEQGSRLSGQIRISNGALVELGGDSSLQGNIALQDGGTVKVNGNTSQGGNYSLYQGGLLDIVEGSVLQANVLLNEQASMTLKNGSGVSGSLTLTGNSRLHVTGDTARTGTVILTGDNQLDISKGSVLNSNLRLSQGSSFTMNNGMKLGGNLQAVGGSTLYISDFSTIEGTYTLEPGQSSLGRSADADADAHTLHFIMNDDMQKATAQNPVLNMLGTLSSRNGARLNITIDMSRVHESPIDDYYCSLFSDNINAISRNVLKDAQVQIVEEDGWVSTLTENQIDYLYGNKPLLNAGGGIGGEGSGVVSRAPAGIGEVATNTLWTTGMSLMSFADTVREHELSGLIGKDRRQTVWVAALGDFFSLNDEGNHAGYEYSSYGYAMGTDYMISDVTVAGLSFGQTFGKNKTNGGLGDIDQDMFMIGANLNVNLYTDQANGEALDLRWFAGYGSSSNKGTILSPDLADDAFSGKWDTDAWVIDMRGTWSKALNESTRLQLFAGLQMQYLSGAQDHYTMTGTWNSYEYSDASMTSFRAPIGASLSRVFLLDNGQNLLCHIGASFTPDIHREDPTVKINSKKRAWEATGSNPGNIFWQINAGAAYQITQDWSVAIGYEYEGAEGMTNNSARISAMYAF